MEPEEDPLDTLFRALMGKEPIESDEVIDQALGRISNFYQEFQFVMEKGNGAEKKEALHLFKQFHYQMRGQLEDFCEKEGLDSAVFDKLIAHPKFQSSSKLAAAKEELKKAEEGIAPFFEKKESTRKKREKNRKKAPSKKRLRRLSNHLRSRA